MLDGTTTLTVTVSTMRKIVAEYLEDHSPEMVEHNRVSDINEQNGMNRGFAITLSPKDTTKIVLPESN